MAKPNYSITSIIIGAIVILALVWVGIGRNKANDTSSTPGPDQAMEANTMPPDQEVVIGWMGPLTGDAASYGESIKQGVELAQADFPEVNIKVVYEDSKCEGKDAVSAINKLVNTDHVAAIIGEVCSGATLAAAPIAAENKIVLISAASTSPKLTEAGPYNFRVIPSDALQGAFGANLAFEDGARNLAILYSNEEYGVGFSDVLETSFLDLGGTIVASETFERTATDVRTQLTKIKAANPDALYIISNSPDSAVAALKQARQLGLTIKLYGSEGLKSPDVITGAGDSAEGLTVTSVSAGTSDFISKHQAQTGTEPGPFAAQGYDAFAALAHTIKNGATTRAQIARSLIDQDFSGASGPIKFDASGDVEGNYDVLNVIDGQFVPAGQEASTTADLSDTSTP